MKRILRPAWIILAQVLVVATASAAEPATTQANSEPVERALLFLRTVAAGDTKAAAAMVDAPASAMWIYGDDIAISRPSHLAEAYPQLAWSFAAMIAEIPTVRGLIGKTGEPQVVTILPDVVVEVKIPVDIPGGKTETWRLVLRRSDQWKLIDIGTGESMFVARENADYQRVKERIAPAAHMLGRKEVVQGLIAEEKRRADAAARRAAPPPRYLTTRYADAVEAARAYIGLAQTKRMGDAMDLFYDWDKMFRLAFGQAYEQMSEGDRNQVQWEMRDFLRPIMTGPELTEWMAGGKFSGFAPTQLPEGRTLVAITFTAKATRNSGRLYFHNCADGWKICDQTLDQSPTTVEQLRAIAQQAKGKTPLEIILAMKPSADRMNERARPAQ